MEKRKRIDTIDFWRGIAIVCMVIYHLLYDLKFVFNRNLEFFTIETWYPFQQFICWSFIFLSGFSTNFSKKVLRNSIKILAGAMVLTLVTTIIMPEFSIKFGVLHLIGTSMLIVSFFKNSKIKRPLLKVFISFGIFLFTWNKNLQTFSFFNKLGDFGFLFPLGFFDENFTSSDYFPLLPWFFLYLSGFYLGYYHENKNRFLINLTISENFLSFIGRNSFIIYMAHQVILMGMLTILNKLGII